MLWTDKIFASQTVVGLEIILRDEDRLFNYSVLKKTKDSFELLITKNNEQTINPLDIPQSALVSIVINGKGIIHKKIHVSENADNRFLLSQILPAVNPDDFFLQKAKASENTVFVSVIRKNIVNNILETLKGLLPKNEIVRVSLGPFCVLKVLTLTEQNRQNEIRFANHYLRYLPDGTVHAYSTEKDIEEINFNFDSIAIPGNNLISFSAAYQFYTEDKDYKVQNIPQVVQTEKRLVEKKNFELTLGALLSFFLLILIINYFVFDHYWNKRNELSTIFSLNQDAFSKLEKLKTDFSERQNFLQTTGFFEPSRLSYYADQIGLDLPESILLTRLNLNPLKTKVNGKESIAFYNKKINVSGTCRKSTEINEWMKSLKQKSWIEDLVMVNYTFDKSKELADFTIEITAHSNE